MIDEELIKNYKKEKFQIEQDINWEEDNLKKYQLKRDNNAVEACRIRLASLYSDLKHINDKINALKEGSQSSSLTFSNPTGISNNPNDLIDDGKVTVKFSVTKESDSESIHEIESTEYIKTSIHKDGDLVHEITEEHTTKETIKKKDNDIDINVKLIR